MSPIARGNAPRTRQPRESNIATACREAHNEIGKFFDWTGSNDFHMSIAWRTEATQAIRAGATRDEAVSACKSAYLEHCRLTHRKPRIDPTPPELAARMFEAIRMTLAGATPAQIAVVDRQAARDFPTDATWLTRWARIWDEMGDTWQSPPSAAEAQSR
jgi:hypothetical protein